MLSDFDWVAVTSAAAAALAARDVTSVRIGRVIDAGSSRSVVMRARAERRADPPLNVVIKVSTGTSDGFRRERAALSLIAEHDLPGAVRLLGWSEDPPLLVLEDLGKGPSVADVLLATDSQAAERALVDWAVVVGTLQAGSVGLAGEFHARLTAPAGVAATDRAGTRLKAPDFLADWLSDAADTLPPLLRSMDLEAGAPALRELRALTPALDASGTSQQGLVPGDTCPDNALYVDGRLTLLDFEAASHRHVAWEAAYLFVPWPTRWCSWAVPDEIAQRALSAWRETVAPVIPAVTTDRFADDLARAVIAWTFLSLTFLLPRALADPGPAASTETPQRRAGPDLRSLVLHRTGAVAAYTTSVLPALQDLAGEIHDACIMRWGQRKLEFAPAFRED